MGRLTKLKVVPLTLRQANDYILEHHRHHGKVQGHRFTLGCERAGELCGVATVGRPTARMTDQYLVAEVTRLCTDGTKNVCSCLYAAAARAAQAMGFEQIQTFILASETGISLKASGWERGNPSAGGSWDRRSRRRSAPDNPQTLEPKVRWFRLL